MIEDFARLPLVTAKDVVVAESLVEWEDFLEFGIHRWYLSPRGYAVRGSGQRDGTYLHRKIMGLEKGDVRVVDHISGDKLDNRRANLRVCTRAENQQNLCSGFSGTSSLRGVYWDASRGKWQARVTVRGRTYFLGRFDVEEDAGRAAAACRAQKMPFSAEAA